MVHYTDNQGVAAIVKSGSTKVHLHKLAMEIFLLSKEHNVSIDIEWIPRSANEVILTTGVLEILIFGPLIPCGGLLQLIVLLIPLMLGVWV